MTKLHTALNWPEMKGTLHLQPELALLGRPQVAHPYHLLM